MKTAYTLLHVALDHDPAALAMAMPVDIDCA